MGASAAVELNQRDKGLQGHLDAAIAAAFGSNEATMNIAIPDIGLNAQQNGEADIDSFSIFSRLTIDGVGEKAWPIKPHLLVGYNNTSQDAFALGNGWTASLSSYVEFGDLEGFGGLLKIGKRF